MITGGDRFEFILSLFTTGYFLLFISPYGFVAIVRDFYEYLQTNQHRDHFCPHSQLIDYFR